MIPWVINQLPNLLLLCCSWQTLPSCRLEMKKFLQCKALCLAHLGGSPIENGQYSCLSVVSVHLILLLVHHFDGKKNCSLNGSSIASYVGSSVESFPLCMGRSTFNQCWFPSLLLVVSERNCYIWKNRAITFSRSQCFLCCSWSLSCVPKDLCAWPTFTVGWRSNIAQKHFHK